MIAKEAIGNNLVITRLFRIKKMHMPINGTKYA